MKLKKFKVVDNSDGYGFRVKWPDGVLSADYYNLTWAKEHCRRLNENYARSLRGRGGIDLEKPAGALFYI